MPRLMRDCEDGADATSVLAFPNLRSGLACERRRNADPTWNGRGLQHPARYLQRSVLDRTVDPPYDAQALDMTTYDFMQAAYPDHHHLMGPPP
jgi:hypothetical protein